MARRPAPQLLPTDRDRALALTPVSRETAERLDAFVALLLRWQERTNLIAPSTIPELWTRHIADSLQLARLAPAAKVWIDLGSGGGFPGLIVAIAAAPGCVVHLVESNAKKAAFLREAARVLDAPARVYCERAEDFAQHFKDHTDVVMARALAPLDVLLRWVAPLMREGTQALLMKGQDVEAELTEASKYWRITADLVPSLTDPAARIMIVRRLEPRR